MSVGPARSDSLGIGVGLSDEEPIAGAVSLRVRGALRVVTGLGGLFVDVIPRSSLVADDCGTRSSTEVGAGSAGVDTGAFSRAVSGVVC